MNGKSRDMGGVMGSRVLDYLLGGLLGFSALAGLHRGLVKTVGSLAGSVLALLVAAGSYKSLAYWMEKEWGVQSLIAAWITKHLPALPIPAFIVFKETGSGLADPVQYVAYLAIMVICFIILLFLITTCSEKVLGILHYFTEKTPLSGLNHFLGMLGGLLKYLLILSLVIGMIYPLSKSGAQLGLASAVSMQGMIENSRIAKELLILFDLLPNWLGLNV